MVVPCQQPIPVQLIGPTYRQQNETVLLKPFRLFPSGLYIDRFLLLFFKSFTNGPESKGWLWGYCAVCSTLDYFYVQKVKELLT